MNKTDDIRLVTGDWVLCKKGAFQDFETWFKDVFFDQELEYPARKFFEKWQVHEWLIDVKAAARDNFKGKGFYRYVYEEDYDTGEAWGFEIEYSETDPR